MTYPIRFFLKNEINRHAFSLFARKNKNGRSAHTDIFSFYVGEDGYLPFLRKLEIFTTLIEAKILIEEWHKEYNQVRPHSALDCRPPAPEAIIPLIIT